MDFGNEWDLRKVRAHDKELEDRGRERDGVFIWDSITSTDSDRVSIPNVLWSNVK